MLNILLTTIISYATNIHDVNKEYHNTFIYKYSNSFGYYVLYGDTTMYNWRYRYVRRGYIYNRFCYDDEIEYRLPPNY